MIWRNRRPKPPLEVLVAELDRLAASGAWDCAAMAHDVRCRGDAAVQRHLAANVEAITFGLARSNAVIAALVTYERVTRGTDLTKTPGPVLDRAAASTMAARLATAQARKRAALARAEERMRQRGLEGLRRIAMNP
jgi:hypothetical protein